ncbi:MAG: hypothetical protein HQL86_02235 [Magnetococcales bacterium]|nr:hypothetical protein [Magnetococcales bacterium]
MKNLLLKSNSPFKPGLMECPVCGNHPMHIYRCMKCGEVRCGSDQCIGSMGTQYKRWARSGTICRNCGEATYRLLVSDSEEMMQFLSEYRRPGRPH